MDLQTTFRRLSDPEYDSFMPFPVAGILKALAAILAAGMCIRWITQ